MPDTVPSAFCVLVHSITIKSNLVGTNIFSTPADSKRLISLPRLYNWQMAESVT